MECTDGFFGFHYIRGMKAIYGYSPNITLHLSGWNNQVTGLEHLNITAEQNIQLGLVMNVSTCRTLAISLCSTNYMIFLRTLHLFRNLKELFVNVPAFDVPTNRVINSVLNTCSSIGSIQDISIISIFMTEEDEPLLNYHDFISPFWCPRIHIFIP